jgi:hypothetical protein
MRHIIHYLLLGVFLLSGINMQAQEPGAPYNPDANADSLIGISDLTEFLQFFGEVFLPVNDDLDNTNEIQQLILSNDTLFLEPNGGYVVISDLLSEPGPNENASVAIIDLDNNDQADQMKWFPCVNACHRLQLNGFSDWRIPTVMDCAEQFDLVGPQLLQLPINDWGYSMIWTSTPSAVNQDNYMNVVQVYHESADYSFFGNSVVISSASCLCIRNN